MVLAFSVVVVLATAWSGFTQNLGVEEGGKIAKNQPRPICPCAHGRRYQQACTKSCTKWCMVLYCIVRSPPPQATPSLSDIIRHYPTLSDIIRHYPTFSDIIRHFPTSSDIIRLTDKDGVHNIIQPINLKIIWRPLNILFIHPSTAQHKHIYRQKQKTDHQ